MKVICKIFLVILVMYMANTLAGVLDDLPTKPSCDPSVSTCVPDKTIPTCKETACLITKAAKDKFEKDNNCKFIECSDEITEVPLSVLQQIFPSSTTMLNAIADELNMALKLSSTQGLINTKRKLAHLLAQVKQEIGANTTLTESLNYKPNVLVSKSSYFRAHPDEAELYGRTANHPANEEAIANRMYANNVGPGNGSVESGDGWKYRGRGIIQLTGKYNYSEFTKYQKKIWGDNVDFVANPEDVLNPKYAVRSALVFWKINNLSIVAEKGVSEKDSNAITQSVNRYTPPASYSARFSHLNTIMNMAFFKECK